MRPETLALASKAAAGSADLRVVLLSQRSTEPLGLCMDPPLGSGNCPEDGSPPRFLHVDVSVGSTNALSVILNSYDDYLNTLRTAAEKHLVVITTDESAMSADSFDAQLKARGPEFEGYVFHGIYAFTAPDILCAINQVPCCDIGVRVGAQYEQLAQQTGGERVDICSREFDAVWDRVVNCW
jgi:hypothetical protein